MLRGYTYPNNWLRLVTNFIGASIAKKYKYRKFLKNFQNNFFEKLKNRNESLQFLQNSYFSIMHNIHNTHSLCVKLMTFNIGNGDPLGVRD